MQVKSTEFVRKTTLHIDCSIVCLKGAIEIKHGEEVECLNEFECAFVKDSEKLKISPEL